ncbi:3-hydroxyacyl-ACP dehydratase FabZ [Amaricoccus tamworthensis]|uniref:3-hydroxyacyl-ACP dehydratase FabZ n=1 Tax=Amaricoccus tamworthensis TaxID=57002 RepID=UPI003C7B58B6
MPLDINADLKQYDVLEIKRMIPHRYPFLMIDRVLNVEPWKTAVGIKNVTSNEPHFEGHFPVRPVMPGVLIVEAMAQTAAVLVVDTLDLIDTNRLVYFMNIDQAKFRKPVVPGDQVELHVEVVRGKTKIWKFNGTAIVDGTVCAEACFTAMIMSPDEADGKD